MLRRYACSTLVTAARSRRLSAVEKRNRSSTRPGRYDADVFVALRKLWHHPHPQKCSIIRFCIVYPPLMVAAVLFHLWFIGDPLVVTLLRVATQLGPQIGIAVGFALIAAGRMRRVGTEQFCAACGYQVAPVGPVSRRCSECGADWTTPNAWTSGRPVRRPELVRLGFVVCVISLLPMGVTIFLRSDAAFYRLTPTDSLIDHISSRAEYIRPEAFDAVFGRSLSPLEESRLATTLLDRRRQRGHLFLRGKDWLLAYLLSGRASEDIKHRYFAETFPLKLVLNVGASVPVVTARLEGETRPFYGGACISLMLDRLYVDGTEVVESRSSPLCEHDRTGGTLRFTPPRPGKYRVRLRALALAHPPPAAAPPIVRGPIGNAIFPARVLLSRDLWFEGDVVVPP